MTPPTTPTTAVLIYNPGASRSAGNVELAVARLSQHLSVTICEVPRSAADWTRCRSLATGADRIILAGGDGTLHRMLPFLLELDRPLAVLPLGTANDLARSLRLPTTLEEACDVAATAPVRDVDVGFVGEHPFLNVASIGLASVVTRRQNKERKRLWRVLSYPLSVIEALRSCRPFRGSIIASDKRIDGVFLQASFGNGRYHGGGLLTAPQAEVDDGLLHVYTIAAARWWTLLPVLPALLLGLHGWTRSVTAFSVDRVDVRTSRPRTITADGEIVGKTKGDVAIYVAKGRLKVVAPAVP